MFDPDRTELALRVIAALVCGGVIGLEREFRSYAAGIRTHALAAEGAALFAITGILMANEAHNIGYPGADPTRIASTVVQGIGFLAAGVIFGSGARVRGLTTAAGLWTTAAIGLLCGGGFFEVAFFATFATVVVLSVFKAVERRAEHVTGHAADPDRDANGGG